MKYVHVVAFNLVAMTFQIRIIKLSYGEKSGSSLDVNGFQLLCFRLPTGYRQALWNFLNAEIAKMIIPRRWAEPPERLIVLNVKSQPSVIWCDSIDGDYLRDGLYGQYILGKPSNGIGNRAIYQPATP